MPWAHLFAVVWGIGDWAVSNVRYHVQKARARGYVPVQATVQSVVRGNAGIATTVEVWYEYQIGNTYCPGTLRRSFIVSHFASDLEARFPLRARVVALHDPIDPRRSFLSPEQHLGAVAVTPTS